MKNYKTIIKLIIAIASAILGVLGSAPDGGGGDDE